MSNRTSMFLPLVVALGAGALLGLSASTQKNRLPAIGGPRPNLEGATPLPVVEIALGVDLSALGGQLKGTVEQVPEVIRKTLGFGPAQLHFREDMTLAPNAYALRLRGLPVAQGALQPDRLLALRTLDSGEAPEFPGETMVDPVSGLPGVWITREDEGRARLFGYDVLEPAFVLALHVDTVLRRHLYELLTREETYRLLDRTKQTAPRTVEELVGKVEVGTVQKVLQNLLREQVSLRDLSLVLELLADAAKPNESDAGLTEAVRLGLARQLSAELADDEGAVHVLPLGGRWEAMRQARPGDALVRDVVAELRPKIKAVQALGLKPVLVAPSELRAHARRLLERDLPELPVLGEREISPEFRIEPIDGQAVGAR